MDGTLKRIALLLSLLILLSFVVLVVNQTAQLVQLAATVHPTLGVVALWVLVGAYALLVGIPLALYFRLPQSLNPPESEDDPEFERHLIRLRGRLAGNTHVKHMNLAGREGVEEALQVLAKKADEVVQKTAGEVFLSTAISQSGRLDAFLVLATQSRMVWRIAHVYYQRPTARELTRLYANVAATAFMASELQNIDFSAQVEPILTSSLGALATTVPGFRLAATVLVNSVLTGSANAFLTLRIGVIAKRYCGSLVVPKRGLLHQAAALEAAQLLGTIVASGCAQVSKAIWQASKDRVGSAVSGIADTAKDAGSRVISKVRPRRTKEQPGNA